MSRRALVLALLAGVGATSLEAQDASRQPLNFGGEFGTFSELYGISGAEQRRPSATGRIYLRPTFSLFGPVTVTGDFLLSTEGNRFGAETRQAMNQYSLRPDWGWGRATIGDFSGSFSPLTWQGVRARGASVEAERGLFRVAAFGGRSQRAVPGGAVSGAYARMLAGGQLGVGDPDRNSLTLVMVSAWDDPGSLPPPQDTLFADQQPDTLFVQDTLSVGRQNQFAVTPQRNLVLSLVGSLTLLDERVRLTGELAGSGHTRDRRSDPIENEELLDRIPGVARSLFTPRTSSTADYAYTLEAQVRPATPLTTTLTFRNLGPGYVSLGTGSLLSDRREIQVRNALRYRRIHGSLDVARQNDNLAGQKSYTTRRDRLGASLSARVTPRWTSTVRLQRATLDNRALEPERWIAYESRLLGTRQSFTLGGQSLLRSVSVDYNWRDTGDDNPLREASASRSHTANASLVIAPSRTLSFTPTAGVVRSRFGDDDWTTRNNLGLGTQLRLLRGRWVNGLNLGRSYVHQTTSLQAAVSSRFQVTSRDAVVLSGRASRFDHATDDDRSFRESSLSLRWTHRF
jgi:hypothetical protein